MLDAEVAKRGSLAEAQWWVFPSDKSMHVQGLAIDVGHGGLVVVGAMADRARPWTRGPVRAVRRPPRPDADAVEVSDGSGAAGR